MLAARSRTLPASESRSRKYRLFLRGPESTKEVLRTLDATKGLFPRSLDAPHGESEGAAAQAPGSAAPEGES